MDIGQAWITPTGGSPGALRDLLVGGAISLDGKDASRSVVTPTGGVQEVLGDLLRTTSLDNIAPVSLWYGYTTLNSWVASSATKSSVPGTASLRVTATAANSYISQTLNLVGADHRYFAFRYRRLLGTHEGNVYWSTAGHATSNSFRAVWDDPGLNVWKTVVLDMWNPAFGGLDWKNSTIIAPRIDAGSDDATVVEFDWIATYRQAPASYVDQLAAIVAALPSRLSILTPEDFGAVGNGIADDTSAIQAMFTALPARGGRVQLSKRYLLSAPITVTGKTAIIEGTGGSPQTRATGFTLGGNSEITMTECDGITLSNFLIEAAADKQAETYLLKLNATSTVTIQDMVLAGRNVAGTRLFSADNSSNRLFFNRVVANGAMGEHALYFGASSIHDFNMVAFGAGPNTDVVVFNGGNSSRWSNFTILFGKKGLYLKKAGYLYMTVGGWENGTDSPIYIEDNTNFQMSSCYIAADTGLGPIPTIYCGLGATDIKISNCIVQGGGGHGIYAGGAHINITGNNILRTGGFQNNTYAGIYVPSTAKRIGITGNIIGSRFNPNADLSGFNEAGGIMKYGVENYLAANEVVISSNILRGAVTAGLGGTVTTGAGIGLNVV